MPSLDRIQLSGFKSIREMDLELRPLNILIGANGSGKSNFVAFFALLREIVEKHLQLYVGTSGGADALLHFGRKSTDEVSCRLWFAEREYRCRLVPSAGDSLVFAEEALDLRVPGFREKHKYTPTEGTNVETKLHEMDRLQVGAALGAGEVLSVLGSWRVYHFHDTSESAKVKATCDLHDNEYLRPDGANLASVLYLLQEKHRDHYRNVVDTVRMVAPFFDDFHLSPSRLNGNKIRLEWRERGTDTYFGPEALSDGSLRFICLATLLLQPELPPLIIVDEPELGLHPAAIGLVAAMLRSAAATTQVIVCTQSVTLVNQFEPEDIVVVDREDRATTFTRLSSEGLSDWLKDYSLGELWEKNVVGGNP